MRENKQRAEPRKLIPPLLQFPKKAQGSSLGNPNFGTWFSRTVSGSPGRQAPALPHTEPLRDTAMAGWAECTSGKMKGNRASQGRGRRAWLSP